MSSSFVDLKLPADKTPMEYGEFLEGNTWRYFVTSSPHTSDSKPKPEFESQARRVRNGIASDLLESTARSVDAANLSHAFSKSPLSAPTLDLPDKNRTAALGSTKRIYSTGDKGLIGAVLEAYNHHWNLRLSADDVWFPVVRRVAKIIDENSGKNLVRDFFVDFTGKKNIQVIVESESIYDVDYEWLFEQFRNGIRENVKVPSYADIIHANFSTTTPELGIVSDITLMSSLKEFFSFEFVTLCGIKAVELLGSLDDWKLLLSKLRQLMKTLAPLDKELELQPWLKEVETIFEKLVETYEEKPDTKWWSRIIDDRVEYGSGGGNFYGGWIVTLVEGRRRKRQEQVSGGLTTVPVKISQLGGVSEDGTLLAGMLGFTVDPSSPNGVPCVRPFQGWALLLDKNSVFRRGRVEKDLAEKTPEGAARSKV